MPKRHGLPGAPRTRPTGTVLAGATERRRPSFRIPVALTAEPLFLGLFMALGLLFFLSPGSSARREFASAFRPWVVAEAIQ